MAAEKKKIENSDEDELNEFYNAEVRQLFGNSMLQTTHVDENETQLLRQSFMLNPSQTVYHYLQTHGAEVADFRRVQLGGDKEED